MVVGAISSRIRYGRMGFLKMSGTLRFMRLLLVYSRSTNPDLGRFKHQPWRLVFGDKKSAHSTQRNDQDVFPIFAPEVAEDVTV